MRPIVGITCCSRQLQGVVYDCVARKYTEAVVETAGCIPLLVPTLGSALDMAGLLARVDGLLFTGSDSNVEPSRYHGAPSRPGVAHDTRRDATTLPLLREAVASAVPVLALCRGHQEMNVAFGGSLHAHLQELQGRLDHREDTRVPESERYGPAHEVTLTPGGALRRLLGVERLQVNSLHEQAIHHVAEALAIEGVAPDGTVEAVRVKDAQVFALGVQWHPEWNAGRDVHARPLWQAFADACRARMQARTG